jgi:hypothetical protein
MNFACRVVDTGSVRPCDGSVNMQPKLSGKSPRLGTDLEFGITSVQLWGEISGERTCQRCSARQN